MATNRLLTLDSSLCHPLLLLLQRYLLQIGMNSYEDSYAATIPAATHKAQVVIKAKLVEIRLVMYLILEAINYYLLL